ncbi:class II fructose-bisphosphate aldolase [Coxiella endosymbiont of Rhipicephalus microplus]|uniref:class II fructose-bisphosphate aldolase n=1 Tax=Coxiella endosymbiont of Rhipicephalus microplus TaxID=1656186 RepID=UPI000C80AA4C|nr:class II fructose-bisphosphate aldolase [Coxiella endosymbiont of Rhipicephalus microplus]PMB54536.1 Fructose-bisphosphate aldolase class II [Coxiella-like endosymbiont]
MALITLRQLLDHAAEHSYGIPAFNINNLEQIRAIMEAADETRSPVIIQVSAGARQYAGSHFIRALILAAIEEWPHIPICMHQDHGASPEVCQRSIQMGFTSVMMDGSLFEDQKTPADYEYNVSVTKLTTQMAHACGVSVEGELGCLGSLETLRAGEEDGSGAEGKLSRNQMLTDPEQAVDFVIKTKVDALAIAIGTSHGAYKFLQPPTGEVLVIDRIKAIHERIPDTHLVMHGSSSVSQEWLNIINKYGGKIPQTYGVPVEEIQESISYGVRKVNIDTDLRLASTGSIRRYLAHNPAQFDPRKYLAEALKAMKAICKMRYEAFGAMGQAEKIKVISIEKMAQRYKNGELEPRIHTKPPIF